MSRPALSALRALEIIDLMAGMPGEAFTLSDIARLTGTNVASCHAILAVMEARGYLLRHPFQKRYRLAPSIVAIGEAAAAHDPLLEAAKAAARDIADKTKEETLLTARAGDDIIGVGRFRAAASNGLSLRVGQRTPLRPPFGALFVAWDEGESHARWIAPNGDSTPQSVRAAHHGALALVRRRGWLASLDSPEYHDFTRTLHQRDERYSLDDPEFARLVNSLDNGLYQPPTIDPGQSYKVTMVAAPIFDSFNRVLYALTSSCRRDMTGQELLDRAEMLVRACSNASAGLDAPNRRTSVV